MQKFAVLASLAGQAAAGPCEDAVAQACPGLTGDDCNTCGLANKATLSKSCSHWPHDMSEACEVSPSPAPTPSPQPTPTPSPTPSPSPSPYPDTPVTPSTASCDALDSCSPTSFCSKVSNEACKFPEPSIDIAAKIEALGCRQCTQASAPICSKAALEDALVLPSGIQAAYCNDEFLVIHANGMPSHDTNLDGVPRPPGGGGSGSYDDQCVTRSFVHQFQTFKVPLTYALLEDGRTNKVYGELPDVALPQSGAIGVAVNGVPLYPNEDNRGETIQQACEADRCMAHVGMGADYHYHGDPFGATCLYNGDNYTAAHPRVIGWGSDGPTIYGRYTAGSQDGAGVALDDCGGHSHGSLAYHYHPNVVQLSGNGKSFDAYMISPLNCWKGDISGIANFWEGTHQINYDNSFTNPPYTPSARSDAEQIKPCCSSAEYYTASGISLPLNSGDIFA